jgi:hypothetical protein
VSITAAGDAAVSGAAGQNRTLTVKFDLPGSKGSAVDGGANFAHQLLVVVQVVNGVEAGAENINNFSNRPTWFNLIYYTYKTFNTSFQFFSERVMLLISESYIALTFISTLMCHPPFTSVILQTFP